MLGKVWKVALGETVRSVEVVAATDSPSWWRCTDLETGVSFLASVRWFVEPVEGSPPLDPTSKTHSKG